MKKYIKNGREIKASIREYNLSSGIDFIATQYQLNPTERNKQLLLKIGKLFDLIVIDNKVLKDTR